ncbi:MAG: ATP-binding protein [Opitutaceae bacterium]
MIPTPTPAPSSAEECLRSAATYFASPERLPPARLREQLQTLTANPVIDELLRTFGGLIAVLNDHRQILATNEVLLGYLGVGSIDDLLGQRLGEAIACPHATEMPAGCGTSRYCRTCGAAIAQAVALHQQKSAERYCAIEVLREGRRADVMLRVRATPCEVAQQKLILVVCDDVSRQQQSALAERSFHHDLNNTLTALLCASSSLATDRCGELATEVHQLATRLARELELQRRLITAIDPAGLEARVRPLRLGAVLDTLRAVAGHHPAAQGKRITIIQPREEIEFAADDTLLLRVLVNMAINALEATPAGGEVRIHTTRESAALAFRVWNEAPIPPEIALRIFQRNFTTKGDLGRGLGTYSMKLVGERLLHGRVEFTSSALEGTTFAFALPL